MNWPIVLIPFILRQLKLAGYVLHKNLLKLKSMKPYIHVVEWNFNFARSYVELQIWSIQPQMEMKGFVLLFLFFIPRWGMFFFNNSIRLIRYTSLYVVHRAERCSVSFCSEQNIALDYIRVLSSTAFCFQNGGSIFTRRHVQRFSMFVPTSWALCQM